MAIEVTFPAIDRDIDLMVSDLLSPEAQVKLIADFAREQAADADAINAAAAGHPVTHTTVVDGRAGAAEETVRLNGKISYFWDLTGDVVDRVYEMVVKASPVKSGRFMRSNLIFADGVEVGPGDHPENVEEWVIMSTVPYARKIERGESVQAPDGVYQAVAAIAAGMFGNSAAIKFSYRSLAEVGATDIVAWASKRPLRQFGRKPRLGANRQKIQFNHDTRNPAIVIRFL